MYVSVSGSPTAFASLCFAQLLDGRGSPAGSKSSDDLGTTPPRSAHNNSNHGHTKVATAPLSYLGIYDISFITTSAIQCCQLYCQTTRNFRSSTPCALETGSRRDSFVKNQLKHTIRTAQLVLITIIITPSLFPSAKHNNSCTSGSDAMRFPTLAARISLGVCVLQCCLCLAARSNLGSPLFCLADRYRCFQEELRCC